MGYDIDEDIDTWELLLLETENKNDNCKEKPDEAGPEDLAPSPKPVVYPDTEKYRDLRKDAGNIQSLFRVLKPRIF